METRFEVRMKSADLAEIDIYGVIGGDMFEDGITSKQVGDLLKKASGAKTIFVYINSGGGSFFEGQAIASQLSRHPARIEVFIDSLAGSAATTIAAAGDVVRMAEDAWYMIHNPWTVAMGDYREFRSQAEKTERFAHSMAEVYARRSGKQVSEIRDMMDEETWMTAKEAMDIGLVDEVTEPARMAACIDMSILEKFKHTPEGMLAKVPGDAPAEADVKADSEETAEIIPLPTRENKELQVKLAKMQTVISKLREDEPSSKVNHEAGSETDAVASNVNVQ